MPTDPKLQRFAESGLRFPRLPESEGYLTSDDCRLYYATFGKGRPVVMLHGGMGKSFASLQCEACPQAPGRPLL